MRKSYVKNYSFAGYSGFQTIAVFLVEVAARVFLYDYTNDGLQNREEMSAMPSLYVALTCFITKIIIFGIKQLSQMGALL